MGADNQQERPSGIASYYVTGFVDGEGCFSVTIQKSNNVRLGIQVIPEFHVSQHQNRTEVLRRIEEVFGCGYIKANNLQNPKDMTSVYVVRNLKDLLNKVVPFFKKYPFISIKQHDFEKFAEVVALMDEGKHLEKKGLTKILKLAFSMNFSGKYRKLKLDDLLSCLESSETVRQKSAKTDEDTVRTA
jgi:hypothetical protein